MVNSQTQHLQYIEPLKLPLNLDQSKHENYLTLRDLRDCSFMIDAPENCRGQTLDLQIKSLTKADSFKNIRMLMG